MPPCDVCRTPTPVTVQDPTDRQFLCPACSTFRERLTTNDRWFLWKLGIRV